MRDAYTVTVTVTITTAPTSSPLAFYDSLTTIYPCPLPLSLPTVVAASVARPPFIATPAAPLALIPAHLGSDTLPDAAGLEQLKTAACTQLLKTRFKLAVDPCELCFPDGHGALRLQQLD